MPPHMMDKGDSAAPAQQKPSRFVLLREFVLKNVLTLGIFVSIAWSLSWPVLGDLVDRLEFAGFRVALTVNVIVVYSISGLTLNTDDVANASAWVGYAFGMLSILVLTACAGFGAMAIPFGKEEFSYGLAVFCIVPTTLSSGISLVMQAGGNDALALLLTVTSHLLGVLTVPFFVKALAASDGASFDAIKLLVKLIFWALIPVATGKLLREFIPAVKRWVTAHRRHLSVTSNLMVVMMIWQTLSRAQPYLTSVTYAEIAALVVACVVLHCFYLGANFLLCLLLGLEHRELEAVMLVASEKSLPVSVTVVSFLGTLGEEGLMIIPCVIGHLSQLLIDSQIASWWASHQKGKVAEDMTFFGGNVGDSVEAKVRKNLNGTTTVQYGAVPGCVSVTRHEGNGEGYPADVVITIS